MCCLALLAALLALTEYAVIAADAPANTSVAVVHAVVTTECLPAFEWQVLGLAYR